MNDTYKCMLISLVLSIAIIAPIIAWELDLNWKIADMPVISWFAMGMDYMDIFFHEIGHSLFDWFYGRPSLPTFDLQDGGGMAYHWEQQNIILLIVYLSMLYAFFYFKEFKSLQIVIIAVFLFHLFTAYNDINEIVSLFMGHGFAIIIGSFLLYRALYDLAPRGKLERYLNAIIGFGLIFSNQITFWHLIRDSGFRAEYYKQKGGHGFGDLSRISDILNTDIISVASFGFIFGLLFLFAPVTLYLFSNKHYIDRHDNKNVTTTANRANKS